MSEIVDLTFKIVLFGNARVGKTSLTRRYLTGIFEEETVSTIGVNIEVKYIKIKGYNIRLQIWDFGGEERFRFFLPGYSLGASAGIFMYDITRRNTLNDIEEWLEVFISPHKKEEDNPQILMVGGKIDLEEQREVSHEEAIKIAKSHSFKGYVECSAKTGANIHSLFNILVQILLEYVGVS